MKLFLLALCFWPFCHKHVEKVNAEIQTNGTAIVHFKKIFTKEPSGIACTPAKSVRSVSKEAVEFFGKPGTKVAGTCQ